MTTSWLLLIHHIPPKPGYLRMKAARQLANLGAVALKNSVYILPDSPGGREDFQWLARQIEEGGGRAFVWASSLLGGLTDAGVREIFEAEREKDYQQLAEELRHLLQNLPPPAHGLDRAAEVESWLTKGRRQQARIQAIDYSGAPAGSLVESLLAELTRWLETVRSGTSSSCLPPPSENFVGRVWVTRQGVRVDRIASAWLIRRHIDPQATFRFVSGPRQEVGGQEIGFDMLDAPFTHEGGRCTFEVLAAHFAPSDGALARLGEVIHDIDLKDGRYGHPEAPGLAVLLEGPAMTGLDDLGRLERGSAILDDMYAYFQTAQ